jgi:hypothetical protein
MTAFCRLRSWFLRRVLGRIPVSELVKVTIETRPVPTPPAFNINLVVPPSKGAVVAPWWCAPGRRVTLVSREEIDQVSARMRSSDLWRDWYYDLPPVGARGVVRRPPAIDGLFEVAFDGYCVILCNTTMVEPVVTGIERVGGGKDWEGIS